MNDIHALTGAYAVDALSDAERAEFEEHLALCADCRAEVASLQEAAALLPLVSETPVPASLRASVLDSIAQVRPLPPVGPEPLHPAAPSAAHSVAAPPAAPSNVVPMRRRRLRTALVAAAAAVVVATGVGVTAQQLGDDGRDGPSIADPTQGPTDSDVAAVLAASDVKVAHPAAGAQLPPGAEATVHWSDDVGRAVIVTSGMPALDPSQVYQLWFQSADDEMLPAGTMTGDSDRPLPLEGDADAAKAVGITIEAAPGVPAPTQNPIAYFSFESA
ncbi:anti-sigma factor [Nocardioides sp. ChNu-153]|uniref:anti-sigma factor n=1 Tax=unclassified Nocardioides TaxID=2615069 RepID=UPI00240620B9|nr:MULTISPECIES: anti-sigma factor [unclassified Nocardioides]MDF9715146.1 anti-sigma factor [Nocardioides sp. ChNu-99]MDN7121076.1 anti-sigma factor [Nocardioides sp. ChNu-153]